MPAPKSRRWHWRPRVPHRARRIETPCQIACVSQNPIYLPRSGPSNCVLPRRRAAEQLGSQTVALTIEQQRVTAGGLEVAIVRAVVLLRMHCDLAAVHVQYHLLGELIASALPINSRLMRASPAKFSSAASISASDACSREVSDASRPQILPEPISRNVGPCGRRWSSSWTRMRPPSGVTRDP